VSSAAVTGEESSAPVEMEFSVGGMTCAACAARVEKKLNAIDGVVAKLNLATERAFVTAPAAVPVQQLIDAVDQAGYRAQLLGSAAAEGAAEGLAPAAGSGTDAARVADLRRRLIVALVLFIPLSDVSVLWSLFPWSRFPGWQWVLIGVAAPVVVWSAWPFHAAALRGARHGAVSMDTLVSLGIAASCGWSVYAMFVLDRGQAWMSAGYLLLHASGGGIYLEVAASVTTFLLAGRLYEAKTRRDAGDAMRELAAAGAQEAYVLEPDGTERRVPVAQLRAGQRFVVRPGGRVAADGEVEFGQSAVDRSMMTGESVPADAAEGDTVAAGTVVVSGRLVVRAVKVGRNTQLAQLVTLVEQAQPSAAAAVGQLRRLGLRSVLLTGDSQVTAQAVPAGSQERVS
jgi:Cu+-exporting ATPase